VRATAYLRGYDAESVALPFHWRKAICCQRRAAWRMLNLSSSNATAGSTC
jgi:hypothetical protein